MFLENKKIMLLAILVLSMVILVGCSGGSYLITIGDIDTTGNSITGSYEKFDGHYFKKVKLEEGQNLKVKFYTVTEEGSIAAQVEDPSGEVILQLEGQDDAQEKEIAINRTGTYSMKVTADKHKGSFQLNWEIE